MQLFMKVCIIEENKSYFNMTIYRKPSPSLRFNGTWLVSRGPSSMAPLLRMASSYGCEQLPVDEQTSIKCATAQCTLTHHLGIQ